MNTDNIIIKGKKKIATASTNRYHQEADRKKA